MLCDWLSFTAEYHSTCSPNKLPFSFKLTKVAWLFALTLRNDDLVDSDKASHLDQTLEGHLLKPCHTVAKVLEVEVLRRAKECVEAVIFRSDETKEAGHCNAAVLHLDGAVVSEIIFGRSVRSVLNQSERVPVTERGEHSKLVLGIHSESRGGGLGN
jgi:hypothetical protein